eukprot:gb/GECH01006872.1/.p1 GENE.gb/GECH01006872.1/~~gb/GECH01006872.1/.p1  ORF type:complete len:458 (+),score=125.44 gb/GECH01006872.1/:1-1374(+)
MECEIPKPKLKLFAKALQCMYKIGPELRIQVFDSHVLLTTLNGAKSAYISVRFNQSFFDRFAVDPRVIQGCQVSLKNLLLAFKSINTMEKAKLELDNEDSKLIIEIKGNFGIIKNYRLHFQEINVTEAVYDKKQYPCQICADSKLFSESIVNFASSIQEITFRLDPQYLSMQSYAEDAESRKNLATTLQIQTNGFEKFHYEEVQDPSASFSFKDFKAMLTFCESCSLPLQMYLGSSSAPIVFSVETDEPQVEMEADLVLAVVKNFEQETSSQSSAMTSRTTTSYSSQRPSQRAESISSFTQNSNATASSHHSNHHHPYHHHHHQSASGINLSPSSSSGQQYQQNSTRSSSTYRNVYNTPVNISNNISDDHRMLNQQELMSLSSHGSSNQDPSAAPAISLSGASTEHAPLHPRGSPNKRKHKEITPDKESKGDDEDEVGSDVEFIAQSPSPPPKRSRL